MVILIATGLFIYLYYTPLSFLCGGRIKLFIAMHDWQIIHALNTKNCIYSFLLLI